MAALAGHIVLPTLKREMRDERSFLPSVSAGYAAVLLIYLLFSSAGYLMFGSATLPEITMNLSQLADRGIYPKWITTTCAAIFVVNPLSKVGVVLEVLGGIVEAWVGGAIGSIGDSRDRIEGRERVVVERVFVLPAEQGRWSVSPPALSDEGAFLDNERDLIDDPETPVVESSDSEDPDELLDHMKIVRALHAVSAPDDEIVDIETGEPDERSPLVPSIEFIRPRIPPNLPVTRQTPPFQSTFVSPALSTGIRMGLLALSISLASLLPSFLHASVLLGCMLSTTTAVLFPCVCYLSICGEGLGWFEKLGVGMVFAAGLLGAIWGSIEVWRIGG